MAKYKPKNKNQKVIYVGERVVGVVTGDTFFKSVKASRHFLRTPRAICFDVASLRDAENYGAKRVEVTDTETGRKFTAELESVWQRGFTLNRGFGEQIAVVMKHWNTGDGESSSTLPAQMALI